MEFESIIQTESLRLSSRGEHESIIQTALLGLSSGGEHESSEETTNRLSAEAQDVSDDDTQDLRELLQGARLTRFGIDHAGNVVCGNWGHHPSYEQWRWRWTSLDRDPMNDKPLMPLTLGGSCQKQRSCCRVGEFSRKQVVYKRIKIVKDTPHTAVGGMA